jgi:hypothetical protein
METTQQATPVVVGDPVWAVDETGAEHVALVTAVHGPWKDVNDQPFVPCINVVYVSDDPARRDPYGQQTDRMSSLQHYSIVANSMTRPGRYWRNVNVSV